MARPSAFLARILPAGLAICKSLVPLVLWGVTVALPFVVGWALIVSALAQVAEGQCPTCENGQCPPTQSRGIGVGLSIGGWRSATPRAARAAVSASPVVPVLFGTDPEPAAGVYVGVIGGQGVTLTCWHIAKYGITSVASEQPMEIIRDRYGYDMAAVLTRPLNVPVARLGQTPRPGDVLTITGYPDGRYGSHTGRVSGYAVANSGQSWSDLLIDVASQNGDSGGAVFNRGGQLVGLLWGTNKDGSAGSRAISVPAIADFLERLRLRCKSPLLPAPETRADLTPKQPEPVARQPLVPVEPAPIDSILQPTDSTNEIAKLRAEIAKLRALIAAMEPRAKGDQGVQGEQGEAGHDGASPTIDYAAVAAEVEALLKPLTFQPVDSQGNPVGDPAVKKLGDTVYLHSYLVEKPK